MTVDSADVCLASWAQGISSELNLPSRGLLLSIFNYHNLRSGSLEVQHRNNRASLSPHKACQRFIDAQRKV